MAADSGVHPSLGELLLGGDPDACAGFFDAHAPAVRAYCFEVCPSSTLDGAIAAAFLDFFGRLRAGQHANADLTTLLLRATRTAAAWRLELPRADCRAAAELLATYANGELARNPKPLRRHVRRCGTCRETERRMERAEAAYEQGSETPPAKTVRAAVLRIVPPGGTS
jgi:hypothetical protein